MIAANALVPVQLRCCWLLQLMRKKPSLAVAATTGSVVEPILIGRPPLSALQGAYAAGKFPPVSSDVKALTFDSLSEMKR